ncbi:hypothetical protein F4860DRAFT_490724, partial [Xylaria cubensis]
MSQSLSSLPLLDLHARMLTDRLTSRVAAVCLLTSISRLGACIASRITTTSGLALPSKCPSCPFPASAKSARETSKDWPAKKKRDSCLKRAGREKDPTRMLPIQPVIYHTDGFGYCHLNCNVCFVKTQCYKVTSDVNCFAMNPVSFETDTHEIFVPSSSRADLYREKRSLGEKL